ncbi:MAG: hypothetical protein ABFD81_02080 [Syntrophaceae bacterium]
MAYTLEKMMNHGYVRLTFDGPVIQAIFEQALKETYAALIRNRWNKIFLDVSRVEINMPMTELYVFVSMFRARMMMDVCFAVLARTDQMQVIGVIEHVAQNSGMEFRGYTDEDAALTWLCGVQGFSPATSTT